MLKSSTLNFLKQLKKHNNRPWFDENKEKYLEAREDFNAFVEQVLLAYGKVEPAIGLLSAKDCVFRIYRDIRFSKDKTPYKTHFSAGINKGGKKVHFPGYHLHIEPGNSYLGGGIWRPDRELLHKIRQEIDYNLDDLLAIIQKPSFRKTYGTFSTENKLIRPPRGYEADNPAIDYLKLKSFTVCCKIPDEELLSADLVKIIVKKFKQAKPLIDFFELAMDG